LPDPRRILIVDDADEARSILAIALGTIANIKVNVFASAEDALAALSDGVPDILVTDYRMGGMNGLELLAALRQRGLAPRCGTVVISGETDPDLRGRSLAAGASAFFAKPFSAGEVRKTVISLLESSP